MTHEVEWKNVKVGWLKEHPKLSEVEIDGDTHTVRVL
jgi:hypothetical protein